jgi:hypothetical protein
VDHLVFASPDLDAGVALVEERLGATMEPGGRHEGFGTRNRLLGFGGRSYMEVVSVDPQGPAPDGPRWFGLDTLETPRLVTWCAAVPTSTADSLPSLVAAGRAAGIDLGEIRQGRRARDDGSLLTWSMTDPWAPREGGVVPFFIDWADSPHPAERLRAACRFVGVRVEHPEADRIEALLGALGLDIRVDPGQAPRVVATLDTPNGIVELT